MTLDILSKIKGIKLTGKNIVRAIVIFLIAINLIIWIRMPEFGRSVSGHLLSDYRFVNRSVEVVGEDEIVKLKYGNIDKYFNIEYIKGQRQHYKVILKNGREFESVYGDMTEIVDGESVPIDIGEFFENEMGLLLLLRAIDDSAGIKSQILGVLILTNIMGAFFALCPKGIIAFRNLGMFKSYEPSELNIYMTAAVGFFLILYSIFMTMKF
ncbi:hypothetical protein R9X47_00200 [Wukongibacter baidiensis]|uniref:hypothetical protein n=1 Tax=Wukongibacter baidiensis TaxID=1723361 RepID=UPI003D7F23D7